MTNQQLYLAIGIPSFLVILSWITIYLQNGKVETRVEAKIDQLRLDMNTRLIVIEGDLRQFFSITGELKGRVDEIAKRPR